MGEEKSVEVIIPVYNEESILEEKMLELHNFLGKNCSIPWHITIFSNGSTDKTVEIGNELSRKYPNISFKHISESGKAKAVKHGFLESTADVVGFMDADLATGLDAFPECLNCIINGEADVAIGNRHMAESKVERSLKRTILSRGYNFIVKFFFPRTKITDTHCGFKFFSTPIAKKLWSQTKSDKWFFDTELLMLAEHNGYKISQIPVSWIDRAESKVKIARIVSEYLFKIMELRVRLWRK